MDLLLPLAVCAAFLLATPVGLKVRIGRQRHLVTVDELPLLVGLALLPATWLVVGFATGVVARYLPMRRLPLLKRVFNVASSVLALLVATLLFRGIVDGGATAAGPRVWLAVAAACTAYALVTGGASVLVMRLVGTEVAGWSFLTTGVLASWVNGATALVAIVVIDANPAAVWMLAVLGVVLAVGYRAYDEMQRRHDELAMLTSFNERVGEWQPGEDVARAILHEVRAILYADVAELVVHGEAPWHLRSQEEAAAVHAQGLVGSLATRVVPLGFERPVVMPHGSRRGAERRLLQALGLRDLLVVPMRHGGATVGSLLVGDRIGDTETFGPPDAELLLAMASQSFAALRAGRTAARLADEERRVARTSTHDALTGLANRRAVDASLTRLLAARGQAAVLLVDLVNFKRVNDALGHEVGDELLVEIADRLRVALLGRALLGRMGGDVFVVCLGAAGEDAVGDVIGRLRGALAVPVVLSGLPLDVRVVVGIALAPMHGAEPSTLLRHAEVALGEAKGTATGVVVYASERDASAPWRLVVAGELRRAIHSRLIECAYQPKVDLRTGAVRGVEALARWTHPQRGVIAPEEFVEVAEENGLIEMLTTEVLSTALAQSAAWAAAGHRVPISINVSARGLNERLVHQVARLLEVHRVVPGMLTLELTETCVMEDPARTGELFSALAGLGVQLSVDDFGTGYSSLSYLARLPVDEIKIDRSFVAAMREEQAARAVVTATIALALQLGCGVVAEGVEDPTTARLLARLGCSTGQGFHWSPPLDLAAATAWIAANDAGQRPVLAP